MSSYSKMSTGQKQVLDRQDFVSLLNLINARCLDEDASLFFDYLLEQKLKLFKVIYPHLEFQIQMRDGPSLNNQSLDQINLTSISSKTKKNKVFLSETISYTDFLMFF